MQRVTVAAVVLVLAACGTDDARVATEESAGPQVELDRAAIVAQEEVWLATRPAAYSYEVETECECFLAGTYSVTADGEDVLSIEPHDVDAEPYRMYSPPILDHAFAMLDEPLALVEDGEMSTGRASAAFDDTYGYPTSFTVSGDALPSFHVEIRDFTPIDPAVTARVPRGLQLGITNQSFDDPHVGVTVTIDGEVLIDRNFAVENQHTTIGYRLPLEPGDHEVIVRADTGAIHQRVVTLDAERRYLYVAYWGGDATSSEAFSVTESDQPPLGSG